MRAINRSRKIPATIVYSPRGATGARTKQKWALRPTQKEKAPRGAFHSVLLGGAPGLSKDHRRHRPPTPALAQTRGGRAFNRNWRRREQALRWLIRCFPWRTTLDLYRQVRPAEASWRPPGRSSRRPSNVAPGRRRALPAGE